MILKSTSRSLALVVLSVAMCAPTLGFAGTAFADDAPAAAVSPDVAPHARHAHEGARATGPCEVARYVVGPLGHIDGFILKDGTVVKTRGESADAMAKQVPLGQTVRVDGWSPSASGGKLMMRAAVYGQHGQIIAPPVRGERTRDPAARKARFQELRAEIKKLPEASANGTVETVIMGRRGAPRALILTDGTSVFLRPSLARAVMARGVRAGDQIQSMGRGATYPAGAAVVIRSITFADGAKFEGRGGRNAQRT
jgi:hypothetical protein